MAWFHRINRCKQQQKQRRRRQLQQLPQQHTTIHNNTQQHTITHKNTPHTHTTHHTPHKTQDTRHKTQDTRHKTRDTRHKTQDTRHNTLPPTHNHQHTTITLQRPATRTWHRGDPSQGRLVKPGAGRGSPLRVAPGDCEGSESNPMMGDTSSGSVARRVRPWRVASLGRVAPALAVPEPCTG